MGYLNTCTFNFNGIGSEEYGLVIGWEGGDSDLPTGFNRQVVKGDVNLSRHKANQYGTTYVDVIPIEFMILHEDGSEFTQAESRAINRWFSPDTYKPLRFNNGNDTENIIYYVICTSITDKVYNGFNAKALVFECDSPFGYTPVIPYRITGGNTKTIINTSDDGNYSPTFTITCDGDYTGNIVITNQSDNNSIMTLKMDDIDVVDDKKILNVDCRLMIVTDGNNKVVPVYKLGWEISYDENSPIQFMDKYWLRLIEGTNKIKVTGDCEVKLLCQFPRKVGVV